MQLSVSTSSEIIRAREHATHSVVTRYHRAFDDELDWIRGLVREHGRGDEDMGRALAMLAESLSAHNILQEFRVFPAFEAGRWREQSLFEAWATDTLRIVSVVDAVREPLRSTEARSVIARRTARLLDDMVDHLAVEAKLLAPWTGLSRSSAPSSVTRVDGIPGGRSTHASP